MVVVSPVIPVFEVIIVKVTVPERLKSVVNLPCASVSMLTLKVEPVICTSALSIGIPFTLFMTCPLTVDFSVVPPPPVPPPPLVETIVESGLQLLIKYGIIRSEIKTARYRKLLVPFGVDPVILTHKIFYIFRNKLV